MSNGHLSSAYACTDISPRQTDKIQTTGTLLTTCYTRQIVPKTPYTSFVHTEVHKKVPILSLDQLLIPHHYTYRYRCSCIFVLVEATLFKKAKGSAIKMRSGWNFTGFVL